MAVSAARLVSSLGGVGMHHRSGLLRLPAQWLGQEREIAARLGVSYLDYRQWFLDRLAKGQRRLGFGWRAMVSQHLGRMLEEAQPDGGCLLVSNADLIICSFGVADREAFWAHLREGYRPVWGLLLTIPAEGKRLISDSEVVRWDEAERLATWDEGV